MYLKILTIKWVCLSVDVFLRLTAKAVAVLLPILGISWIFGVLAVNTHYLAFLYIFAVFNSLQVSFSLRQACLYQNVCSHFREKWQYFSWNCFQGFFVFLFHCLLNSEVWCKIVFFSFNVEHIWNVGVFLSENGILLLICLTLTHYIGSSCFQT